MLKKPEPISSAAWASSRAWSEVCNSQGQQASFRFDLDSQSTALVALSLLLFPLGGFGKVEEVEERQWPLSAFSIWGDALVSGVCVSPWQNGVDHLPNSQQAAQVPSPLSPSPSPPRQVSRAATVQASALRLQEALLFCLSAPAGAAAVRLLLKTLHCVFFTSSIHLCSSQTQGLIH